MDDEQRFLIAAIRERVGEFIRSDHLIQMAVDALLAGVDTPALRELAGLTRAEEGDAHDLFGQVIHELGLAASVPDEPEAARWALVRWWCLLIVDGQLRPEEAGRLIWIEGWGRFEHPAALRPLVNWVCAWEGWDEHDSVPLETYRQRIVAEAERLLTGPWPPTVG